MAEEDRKLQTQLAQISILQPEEHRALHLFSQRYNKVILDKYALDAQRSQLQQENDQLKAVLKGYLEGISVSEEILSKQNPLLVINGKTNVKYAYYLFLPFCLTRF
jgi:hypothetical protein